jgi:hypothetical protein
VFGLLLGCDGGLFILARTKACCDNTQKVKVSSLLKLVRASTTYV